MKYVMTSDAMPLSIPDCVKHSDFVNMIMSSKAVPFEKKIVSAGFYCIENGKVKTFGFSESLGLSPDKIDEIIIQHWIERGLE